MSATHRVLVAEDDALLREILQEGLEADGFEVVPAEDGVRALELFRTSGPYDVLLLDEEMPGLTGRQLLGQIRAAGAGVPVVLISGNLELSPEERAALRIGPVLRKPISLEELCREIRRAIAAAAP